MLVWPRHKFDLKLHHLLRDPFPAYEFDDEASEGALRLNGHLEDRPEAT